MNVKDVFTQLVGGARDQMQPAECARVDGMLHFALECRGGSWTQLNPLDVIELGVGVLACPDCDQFIPLQWYQQVITLEAFERYLVQLSGAPPEEFATRTRSWQGLGFEVLEQVEERTRAWIEDERSRLRASIESTGQVHAIRARQDTEFEHDWLNLLVLIGWDLGLRAVVRVPAHLQEKFAELRRLEVEAVADIDPDTLETAIALWVDRTSSTFGDAVKLAERL